MRSLAIMGLFCALSLAVGAPAYAGDDDSKDKKDDSNNFVVLKPLMLPILSNAGGIEQFISVTVTLEMDDAASAAKVQSIAPRVVDAYLQDLYGAIDNHKVIHGGVIDPVALKSELEASSSRVLGSIPCKVLLQNIGQHTVHDEGRAL